MFSHSIKDERGKYVFLLVLLPFENEIFVACVHSQSLMHRSEIYTTHVLVGWLHRAKSQITIIKNLYISDQHSLFKFGEPQQNDVSFTIQHASFLNSCRFLCLLNCYYQSVHVAFLILLPMPRNLIHYTKERIIHSAMQCPCTHACTTYVCTSQSHHLFTVIVQACIVLLLTNSPLPCLTNKAAEGSFRTYINISSSSVQCRQKNNHFLERKKLHTR